MAFFKSRKGGDEAAATARQPESVEVMRRRAKHRLIGASVLVLVGVVAFPILFDTQPRPISVDIPIEIPDRAKAKPLVAPATPPAATTTPAPAVTQAPPAAPVASASGTVAKVEPKAEAKPAEAKPETKPEAKAESKAESRPQSPKGNDGSRAQALLEGKPVLVSPPPAAAEGRFVVQVGAFSDVAKAREARAKLEHAGLKTYTQVVETKDGKRIRVRVGPFASKAEADKAADKVKGLELQAAVLTL